MTAPRTAIREAFAGLLTAQLVGDGKPVKEVFAYRVSDFEGKTPVIALGAGGTDRQRLTTQGGRKGYLLDLYIFVLYALLDEQEQLVLDANGQPVWNERDAEDTMDLLEEQVGELVAGLKSNRPLWQSVSYGAPSQPEVVTLGGFPYYLEVVPLRFEVF